MIVEFYAVANDNPPQQLQINDKVAGIFMEMLREAERCSSRMNYVPLPLKSKSASGAGLVVWLARYVWGVVFNTFSKELSSTCVRKVILNWKHEMHRAGMGL